VHNLIYLVFRYRQDGTATPIVAEQATALSHTTSSAIQEEAEDSGVNGAPELIDKSSTSSSFKQPSSEVDFGLTISFLRNIIISCVI